MCLLFTINIEWTLTTVFACSNKPRSFSVQREQAQWHVVVVLNATLVFPPPSSRDHNPSSYENIDCIPLIIVNFLEFDP